MIHAGLIQDAVTHRDQFYASLSRFARAKFNLTLMADNMTQVLKQLVLAPAFFLPMFDYSDGDSYKPPILEGKFKMPFNTFAVSVDEDANGITSLLVFQRAEPYPDMLASGVTDNVAVHTLAKYRGTWISNPSVLLMVMGDDIGSWMLGIGTEFAQYDVVEANYGKMGRILTSDGTSVPADMHHHQDALVDGALAILSRLAQSKDVVYAAPSETRNNVMQVAKSKKPLWEYKVVKLSQVRDKSVWKGGTHASPRFHPKRGHERICASGKRVWVSPCYVGDPKNGVIEHDYDGRAGQ